MEDIRMIDLFLKHNNRQFKLTLPASRWDVLDAQSKLGGGSLSDSIVRFNGPDSVNGLLENMKRGPRFFDELNYFARRIADMSQNERTRFGGALTIHGADDMKALINLTGHLDDIVTADVDTEYALGKFLLENDFVDFSDDVIPYLDFAKIGAEHRANNTCAFFGGMYFEDLNPKIKEIYDGVTIPEMPDLPYVFIVTISGYFPDLTTDLLLPATDTEIADAISEHNALYLSDIYIVNAESRIALLNQAVRPYGQTAEDLSFGELNDLAQRISEMDDAGYIKFLAVLEKEQIFATDFNIYDIPTIEMILECAGRMNEYDFDPGIRPQDVGSYGFIIAAEEQKLEQTADYGMEMGMQT
jgi:hypothetical protein